MQEKRLRSLSTGGRRHQACSRGGRAGHSQHRDRREFSRSCRSTRRVRKSSKSRCETGRSRDVLKSSRFTRSPSSEASPIHTAMTSPWSVPPLRSLPAGTRWQVYCDLDGVLADFDRGVVERTGNMPKEFARRRRMWRLLAPPRTEEFFARLHWMQGGVDLWRYLEPLCPAILTGSPSGTWAAPQKRRWCEKRLRVPADRVLVVDASDKELFSHPGAVLVDDRSEYRQGWEARGGIFIHYKDAMGSIEEVRRALQQLYSLGAFPPVWPRSPPTASPERPLGKMQALCSLGIESDFEMLPPSRECIDLALNR
eukprot:TRINITY_DN95403_c0_g1_i1.p1 TRINITY_DN95403_c0_g1~~TRINITY_DN95403_c0_g1_i1.p1  ORF type:complete len:339 (-),score=42.54 TRINITY_DN95403_c0_g1_i1:56-988(-)